jgi:hypothetical protein
VIIAAPSVFFLAFKALWPNLTLHISLNTEAAMITRRTRLYLVIVILFARPLVAQVKSQIIQGQELEEFLRAAKILEAKPIGKGVTLPQKLTLALDGKTRFGTFKSIDISKPVQTFSSGQIEPAFQDSWRTEIAAYELDKLIGLGMIPATVERTYDSTKGSEQFWVDSMMMEADRLKNKVNPPNAQQWNLAYQKVQLFDNLIYNTDRNTGNLLITKDWEIILIDHSRSFRPFNALKQPKSMTRFSKSLLEGIERLNTANLTEHLGNYISKGQIEALLKRRDAIVAQAKKMAAERGEEKVFY